ncbi:rhomboid family intramembrane serine protease [uncultured Hymenobacter sp.]|uniref:rhomboid family intramembrane serine protease n=1 Tax=uncultured Hymenobacter sp. TaxID=170016 RepID=UPI0035CABDFB
MFNLTPTVRNLLIANVILFLIQTSLLPGLTQLGSLYPIGSPYLQPWQFVTYMFLHGSWGHILSNMFGLISFGPLLEQRWGAQRFLTFWLVCGIGAGVLYEGVRFYEINRMEQARQEYHRNPSGGDFAEFFRQYLPDAHGYESVAAALQRNPQSQELIASTTQTIDEVVTQTRDSRNGGMLGASGALFGILFAFAYLFPNTELFLLFFPFPIKAKYLVFFYAMYELYSGVHRTPGDNVAHFAHLGGLVIGFVILKVWERGRGQFY